MASSGIGDAEFKELSSNLIIHSNRALLPSNEPSSIGNAVAPFCSKSNTFLCMFSRSFGVILQYSCYSRLKSYQNSPFFSLTILLKLRCKIQV